MRHGILNHWISIVILRLRNISWVRFSTRTIPISTLSLAEAENIVYHGWGDDMVPSQVSIDYWASVNSKMGESRAREFYRLFMIPGMAHCGGGPGADILFHSEKASVVPLDPERDLLTALEQWVELGRVPAKFVASRVNEQDVVERTRLICAYPIRAKYRGEGDTTRAENFYCSAK
jgi:feruloyl esterase